MSTLEAIAAIVGVVGGIVGLGSAFIGWEQWKKINQKIAMITDHSEIGEILPAWYSSRMMGDYWLFGVTTTDGKIYAINRISAVSDDGQWMDVILASKDEIEGIDLPGPIICAVVGDRPEASIKVSNIVTALELQTS